MKFNKEITIGICVVFALVALFFGINFLKGTNLFKSTNLYYVEYEDVAGLQASAPVTLNGFKVGQVNNIEYQYQNPGHIRVELSLDRELALREGTKAVIEQDLLGTSTVILHMGSASAVIPSGSTLEGSTATGLMASLSTELLPNVGAITAKIDTLLTSLNAVVADPALIAAISRLDGITRDLGTTMANASRATSSLPATMKSVNDITANVTEMTAQLAEVSAKINRAPIDSTMQNLAALSANLKTLSEQLNDPDSSLGMITRDSALYDNLNSCAASLDSLLIDVKRNPKRYISIKLL